MADRREQLLARLAVICGAVPGIVLSGRNLIDPPDTLLPAAIVFGGEEEVDERDQTMGRQGTTPVRVHMMPYIVITAMAPPGNIVMGGGTAIWEDMLGPTMNGLRRQLVKAVIEDAGLKSFYGTNGRAIYHGMSETIEPGRAAIGKQSIAFQITYPLASFEL